MPDMRILIGLILVVLLSGGAWILNFEKNFVPLAPCRSGLEGKFLVEKDCEAYWETSWPRTWREVYGRILDEFITRYTGYWAAKDWLDPEAHPLPAAPPRKAWI